MIIKEKAGAIFIEDYIIPTGREKADIKARENVILANATKVGTDKPQSKRQEKFVEMIIMNVDTPTFLPYFAQVKMLVGVTKQKKNAKKIQYSITAIEPVT